MNFTAKDVADLRAKTGCGMMDCKKALTEAEGDVEKATEILREKGLAASVKKASRIAAEGVAYAMVSECGKVGVVIEVNAETDFVAKNAQFIDFVKTCAETVIYENPADVEALLAAKAHGSDMTVDAMLKDKISPSARTSRSVASSVTRATALLTYTAAAESAFSFVLRPRMFRQKFSTSAARTSQCRLPL